VNSVNKTVVRIAGKEYYVRSIESDEYIQRLALYLDKKMGKILESSNKLSTSMAAVLTALNVTDDFFKSREKVVSLEEELKIKKEKLVSLENEKNRLHAEREALINELNELKIELVKSETELKEVRNNYNKNYRK